MTWKKFGMIWLVAGLFILMQVAVIVFAVSILSDKITQMTKAGATAANGMGGIPWEVGEGWVLVRNNRKQPAGAIVDSGLEVAGFHAGAPTQPVQTSQGSTLWGIAPGDHLLLHFGPNSRSKQNVRPVPFALVHFTAHADFTSGDEGSVRPRIDQPTPLTELHMGCWIIDLSDDSDGWLQAQMTSYRFLDRHFCSTLDALGCEKLLPPMRVPLDPSH